MRVEVAVLGTPLLIFGAPARIFEQSDWNLPWEQRARVNLEVDETVAVGEILDRAAAELGIYVSDAYYQPPSLRVADNVSGVAFFRDSEDEGRNGDGAMTCTVLDDDGTVRWNQPILKLPIGRLIDASEHRLLDGNPRKIYLIPHPPGGGAFGEIDWAYVLAGLSFVWNFLATFDGAVGGIERLRRIFNSAVRSIGRLKDRWISHHGDLGDVYELVEGRPAWQEDELAGLLGCSRSDLSDLLPAFGLVPGGDGMWQRDNSAIAARSRAITLTILCAVSSGLVTDADGQAFRALLTTVTNMETPPSPEEISELVNQTIRETPDEQPWEPPQ